MEQWSSYISEFCSEGYLASLSSVSNDHTALHFDEFEGEYHDGEMTSEDSHRSSQVIHFCDQVMKGDLVYIAHAHRA